MSNMCKVCAHHIIKNEISFFLPSNRISATPAVALSTFLLVESSAMVKVFDVVIMVPSINFTRYVS